jgi:hypothetical protein
MSDGPSWINGPWWMRAVAFLGFPIVVAMVLLGVLVGVLPSTLTVVAQDVKDLKTSSEGEHRESTKVLHDIVREMRKQSDESTKVLRTICVNSAKTDQERRECLR